MSDRDDFEREQEADAAQEAGAIGGRVSSEPPTELESEMDEAERAVSEGGGGESEGFELAEMELQEHASHGDSHSAGRIIEDADLLDDDGMSEDRLAAPAGEGDEESRQDD